MLDSVRTDQTGSRILSRQRVDLTEASQLLGISSEAVRKRLKRGQLDGEKGADGRVYVWVDTGRTETDESHYELIDEMRERIELLERELADWKREAERKDHLLAAALDRIPAIEAPQTDAEDSAEPRESVVSDSETASKGDVLQEQAEAKIKRSWWQRFFGS